MGLFDKKTATNKKGNAAVKGKENGKDNVKKKPLKGLARSVQDILDFEGITENGIIVSKDYYSKLYKKPYNLFPQMHPVLP